MIKNKPTPKKNLLPSIKVTWVRADRKQYSATLHLLHFAFSIALVVGMFSFFTFQIVDGKHGFYVPDVDRLPNWFAPQNVIVLLPEQFGMEANLNLALHELGHWWWYEKLSGDQRAEYALIRDSTPGATVWLPFGADYALSSLEEDFAESFAAAFVCDYDPSRVGVWEGDQGLRRDFFEDQVVVSSEAIGFNLRNNRFVFND